MKARQSSRRRLLSMLAVVAVFALASASNSGWGSLSAWGSGSLAGICPLGYLETALASRSFLPYLFLSFAAVAALTVLFGRFFCGWLCPVPLVRKVMTNRLEEENDVGGPVRQAIEQSAGKPRPHPATGLAALGLALGSSAVFGFPVFCLICPVGLTLATIVALLRLVNLNDPSWDILIFPAVIALELVALRHWCRDFCPLGALLSLLARGHRLLLPRVDRQRCLEENGGIACQSCRSVCSLDIDLKNNDGSVDIHACSKCRACADKCPAQAIRFPWR